VHCHRNPFTYDTLNRLSTKAPPAEATVTYAYDQASHLISVSDTSASITAPAASASYSENLAYDQLNRPLTVNWTPAPSQTTPSAASASFMFGYDPTNRRVNQSATDNSWWSYPATATKVSYTTNNLNQYTAVGSVSPTYDGNGNLTYDGSFTYGYDAENRLISASGTGLTASYAYDAQGRRKSKTVNGTTTIYVTDADNREVLEYNGSSGVIQNWYSFAPANAFGPDAVLNQMNVASGTRATFIPDILGSFVGTLDAASGTLTKFGYQTFGENPSLTSGSFQYTARRFDPETAGSAAQPSGLYYYRARMYSPAWGRFPQPDPVGMKRLLAAATAGPQSAQAPQPPSIAVAAAPNVLPGTGATIGSTGSNVPSAFWYVAAENLYGYGGNDPINNVDPNGQDPFIGAPVGFVVGAIYGGIGAYLSPGSTPTSWVVGAIAGGLVGGAVGAVDFTNVVAAGAVGGLASVVGDLASQVTVNVIAGQAPFSNINYGSTIGAGIGGAIGGAAGVPLTSALLNAGWSELGATTVSAGLTGVPGLLGGSTGASWYSSLGTTPTSAK
jgi:RHS repeat-associated protein